METNDRKTQDGWFQQHRRPQIVSIFERLCAASTNNYSLPGMPMGFGAGSGSERRLRQKKNATSA
jgi:hypothetical protein